jgi:hypothetical protein
MDDGLACCLLAIALSRYQNIIQCAGPWMWILPSPTLLHASVHHHLAHSARGDRQNPLPGLGHGRPLLFVCVPALGEPGSAELLFATQC